jgi:hypothetical protein
MDSWMKAGLSLVVVAASLYIIVTKDRDPEARGFAYWIVGYVLGYWLR